MDFAYNNIINKTINILAINEDILEILGLYRSYLGIITDASED